MFSLTWAHLGVHGWGGRAQWVAAHCKGLEKRPDEMGQEVPQQGEGQVEVHERLGELEVPVEPCGLEWDWWLETWRLNTSGADQNISTFLEFLRFKPSSCLSIYDQPQRF